MEKEKQNKKRMLALKFIHFFLIFTRYYIFKWFKIDVKSWNYTFISRINFKNVCFTFKNINFKVKFLVKIKNH